MSLQGDNKHHGLLNSLPTQLGLLTVAVIILLLIASRYIW